MTRVAPHRLFKLCDECGRRAGAMRERTRPRDYTVERRLLCTECARTLGYQAPYQRRTW